MRKKTVALYLSYAACLCLLLGCMTTAPYQAMSDAKQALAGAQAYLRQQNNPAAKDVQDYQQAESALNAAEQAMSRGQHSQARALIDQSRQHSQAILKRRQSPSKSNVQFRY